jgi:disulfide bond formation protein DsbB
MITVYTVRSKPRPRIWLALAAALVIAAMAAGLYLQYAAGLEPCPLCVMQRVAFVAAGAVALLGLALPARGQLLAGILATVCALLGGAIAAWHSWILAYPPESLSCGRPFEWFNAEFPLFVWLPKLFRGEGDCLAVEWSMLGLTVPHWALISFVLLLILTIAATRAAWRAARRY